MSDKQKVVDIAMSQIVKEFGKGSIMKMGDVPSLNIESVSTGSIILNSALGVGGVPKGRIIEIFGPESSGKTTLALHIVAEAQKNGGLCAFIDAEHALDPKYAGNIGVNTEELLISQPDFGEQALEITEMLIRSGGIEVIVVDSVAALIPKAELDGDMIDTHVGLQARLMSKALRKLTSVVSKSSTVVIFVNQLREKIGIMFGNPEVTPGGRALKFYSSVRLDVRRKEILKKGDQILGNAIKIKVVKNKVAPPFKEAELEIMYGRGISLEAEVIQLGVAYEFIEKSGAWFSYKGERIGQGRENVKEFMKNNPEIMAEIKTSIVAKMGADADK
jgi:recombination protein RecA